MLIPIRFVTKYFPFFFQQQKHQFSNVVNVRLFLLSFALTDVVILDYNSNKAFDYKNAPVFFMFAICLKDKKLIMSLFNYVT